MAHFAQLDESNNVIQVIVINNNDTLNVDGQEDENVGIAFCKSLFGENTIWKQTSYNANFRKNYAGTGFKYNAEYDAFEPPQPYKNWTLNYQTFHWEPPVPYPIEERGKYYRWDEDTDNWIVYYDDSQPI